MQNSAKAWWLASLTCLAGCLPSGEQTGGGRTDEELAEISGQLSESAVRTLVAGSNTEAGESLADQFGSSVALSDDGLTMVIGAPAEDSRSATEPDDDSLVDSGAAYVFTRSARDADWAQQAYLKSSNAWSHQYFGVVVAISGDGKYLAVGAPLESTDGIGPSTPTMQSAGAVYVFRHDAGGAGWVHDAYVKASRPRDFDYFGSTVALSSDGSTLAVGAFGGDEGSLDDAGQAYVFGRGPSGWTQQALLVASNADAWDGFGSQVALDGSGNLLAVSAPYDTSDAVDGNADESPDAWVGSVYVFAFEAAEDGSGFAWKQQSHIKNPDAALIDGGDYFGGSLALSSDGSTLAIGAPEEDSDARGINGDPTNNEAWASGAAYVFRAAANGSWTQEAYVKPNNTDDTDRFGNALALSNNGDYLAVGARLEDSIAHEAIGGDPFNNRGLDRGAAYVFERTGTEWAQQAYLKPAGSRILKAGAPEGFGTSLDVNGAGDVIAVGTERCSRNRAGVFTFTDP
jgi:hypothetical protein